jgi:polar amino acid transport system permease protein
LNQQDTQLKTAVNIALLIVFLILLILGVKFALDRTDYPWAWYRVPDYLAFAPDDPADAVFFGLKPGLLLRGLWITLELSVYSTILAIVLGLITGLARISNTPFLRWIAIGYIELIRGTPLLVQIFIFYFFVGDIFGMDRFAAGTAALAIFAGAYVAEIVRAGIQSINKGQIEAARSLGMNYFQSMRYIILPQAFRRIMPPLAGQFISLIKDSSLVSAIAITDLTKAGRELVTVSFAAFEIWFTVAIMYLVLTFSLSMLIQYLERRWGVGTR